MTYALVKSTSPVSVKRHVHYRPFLVDHLFGTTLRHWEFEMRVLGAQSLRVISELDLPKLGPENAARAVWRLYHGGRGLLTTRQAELLSYPDISEIHGGLVALAELASSFKAHSLKQERQQVCVPYLIVGSWDQLPSRSLATSRVSR